MGNNSSKMKGFSVFTKYINIIDPERNFKKSILLHCRSKRREKWCNKDDENIWKGKYIKKR